MLVDAGFILSVALFLLLILASGFYSGSEVAMFSLSAAAVKRMRDRGTAADLRVIRLLDHPRKLLISILIGNTIVNTAAAIIAALLTVRVARVFLLNENFAVFVEIVVVTFIIVVVSEITPKVIAVKNPEQFARVMIRPLYVVYVMLYPLTEILVSLTALVQRFVRYDPRRSAITKHELKTLVDVGKERGMLPKDEHRIIHGLVDLGERLVREVMVPRMTMVAVEVSTSVSDVIKLIRTTGYSRIPVYQKSLDDVQGILYAKDLLPYIRQRKKTPGVALLKLTRPALFAPETKKIGYLLKEFQQKKIHMAIVVDEYGGTAGLVTFKDIVDEIVGEIRERYDLTQPLFERLDDRTILFDGRIDVQEAGEILRVPLSNPDEIGTDYDTLGGFLLRLIGGIPQEQHTVRFKNLDFIVERVEKRRIAKVRVVIRAPETAIQTSC
ncbi:MAG: hemolysin family protein [Bacteroidota bacterium]